MAAFTGSPPTHCISARSLWLVCAAVLSMVFSGCAQNSYVLQGQVEQMQQQQLALSQRLTELQSRAVTLDRDNQELQTLLAQSQQQARIHEDQVALLKEQLATVNSQLARTQETYAETERKAQAMAASLKNRASASISANSSFHERLPAVNIPGVDVRADGDVIRIELPASKIFEPGGARLLSTSTTLLDAVAAEVARAYPQQLIGVEGHTDSQPLRGGPWASNHQLSVGRAMAVYDFLVMRGVLRPEQMSVMGHGGNHPVVSNGTPAGRDRNNRVELVIYPERMRN